MIQTKDRQVRQYFVNPFCLILKLYLLLFFLYFVPKIHFPVTCYQFSSHIYFYAPRFLINSSLTIFGFALPLLSCIIFPTNRLTSFPCSVPVCFLWILFQNLFNNYLYFRIIRNLRKILFGFFVNLYLFFIVFSCKSLLKISLDAVTLILSLNTESASIAITLLSR